ncbi:MAG: HD domain-containing phosphohydrolase [Longimicrobiales bacterium]
MPNSHDARILDSAILIVDDEAANLEFLEHALRPVGYTRILGTTDPREAEELFSEFRPDLVLLDLMMPHLDGIALIGRLAPRVDPDDFLPFVILSADASKADVRRALSNGASDFLSKPLGVHEVRLRIRNLLRTRMLHRELRGQNRRLEERVMDRTRELMARSFELEGARSEILDRLARAAEYRDDATGEHTIRVGRIAAELARELDLPEDEVELIRRVAPLHDVGKIGIPDHILLKRGVLSASEFELMQSHTEIGAELLRGSGHPILARAEEIARCHHERWDGTGYPNGLAGEEIPISGRIVAVADVFDSLTHARPYKPAWTIDETLGEIRLQSERQFDPAVVEALFRLYQKGHLDEPASTPPLTPSATHAWAASGPAAGQTLNAEDEVEHNPEALITLLEQERARLTRRVEQLERALRENGAGPSGSSAA